MNYPPVHLPEPPIDEPAARTVEPPLKSLTGKAEVWFTIHATAPGGASLKFIHAMHAPSVKNALAAQGVYLAEIDDVEVAREGEEFLL
jgi:hypothetical protein